MFLFIFINSIILFILMQAIGVPLSNLSALKFEYDTFSFSRDKTIAGMNIIYNIFLSNIYMLLVYEIIDDNQMKKSVYLIVLGYLFIRYFFIIIILNRFNLLNLKYESLLVLLTVFFTYFINVSIIEKNISIKIPIEDFKNEIALLIIIFLYNVFKNSLIKGFSDRNNTSNRKNYIRYYYFKFLDKYDKQINDKIDELETFSTAIESEKRDFKLLVYSFMIYENYSRPKVFRKIENIFSNVSNKEISTGLMQIKSKYTYTDKDSLDIGVNKLSDAFFNYYSEEFMYGDLWIDSICDIYNPQEGYDYINEIKYIFYELKILTLSC